MNSNAQNSGVHQTCGQLIVANLKKKIPSTMKAKSKKKSHLEIADSQTAIYHFNIYLLSISPMIYRYFKIKSLEKSCRAFLILSNETYSFESICPRNVERRGKDWDSFTRTYGKVLKIKQVYFYSNVYLPMISFLCFKPHSAIT